MSDLAFIGRDTRGIDDGPTLFADRRFGREPLRKQPQHVERANQIDVDDADEFCERVDPILADRALRSADAGAVHQYPGDAMRSLALGDRRLDLLLVGDVGHHRDTFHLGRDLFGIFLALIEHGNLCALGGHGARGCGAEAGATAGDENGNIFQLHW